MSCPYKRIEKKRINNSKTALPLQFRDISKKEFRSLSFDNVHKFYYTAHAINLENHNFRKILYDAFFDALENKNGKIHRRDYLNEIEKFNDRYYQVASSEDLEKIKKWKEYRESPEYKEFLRYVRQVDRLEHRADLTISNALAYMYAKHQDKNTIYEAVETLEEKLKINKIPEVWSKSSLWFITNLAFFNQLSFLAKVGRVPIAIDATQFLVKDLGVDIDIELEVKKDWWDNKFYYHLTDNEKLFYRIYNDIIATSVGETGSVMLAEAAKAGTSLALHFGAKVLTGIATMHPSFKALKVGAYIIEGVKEVLDKSVFAWLGWQIGVEWSLDGWIQSTMKRIGEALYRFTEGELWENAWNFTNITRSERYELMKDYFKEYKNLYEMLVNYYRSHKSHELYNELRNAIDRFLNYGDVLGVRERTEKLINKFFAEWRAFEARFRLHEFYQHAKREYETLKNYEKQAYQDYKKAIKVYCYTSSEKDAINLLNKQINLLSIMLARDAKAGSISIMHDFNQKLASGYIKEFYYKKPTLIYSIMRFLNALDDGIKQLSEYLNKVNNAIKNKKYDEVLENGFSYGKGESESTGFGHQFYSWVSINCGIEFNKTIRMFPLLYPFYDYSEKHFTNNLKLIISIDCWWAVQDVEWVNAFYPYIADSYNLYYKYSASYQTNYIKKTYGSFDPYTELSEPITLKDIQVLSFSFITDFKKDERFLNNLVDNIYIDRSSKPVSICDIKSIGNLLKFVQRNKCFSVKRKTYNVKRYRPDNVFFKYPWFVGIPTKIAGAYFITNINRSVSIDLNGQVKNYNSEIAKEMIKLFDFFKIQGFGEPYYSNPQGYLDFWLYHKDTFSKKNVDISKKVYVHVVNKRNLKIKSNSKRSKVLCFVSSQR